MADLEVEAEAVTRWLIIAVATIAVGVQAVRPARTNPAADASRSLHAQVRVPQEVTAVLDRACRDCHSNETRWPWYSAVAPVSWFVIDHVNHGRSHFNYSDWRQYGRDDATRLLQNACAFARKGTMPLPSYLRMHPEARLDHDDVAALCAWTDTVLRPGGGAQ